MSVATVHCKIAKRKVSSRMGECLNGLPYVVRFDPVVSIDKCHKLTGRERDALIKGVAYAVIGIGYPKVNITLIATYYVESSIYRASVDY